MPKASAYLKISLTLVLIFKSKLLLAVVFGAPLTLDHREAKFIVALVKNSATESKFICTGTFIHKFDQKGLVLSDDHCQSATHIRFGVDPMNRPIGENLITKKIRRGSRNIYRFNPNFFAKAITYQLLNFLNIRDHDLSIYKFSGPTPEEYQPATLSDAIHKPSEHMAVGGYGAHNVDAIGDSIGLLNLGVVRIDHKTSKFRTKIRSQQSERPEVTNGCIGDSGGPLMSYGEGDKEPVVFGLFSSVRSDCLYGQSTYESITYHYLSLIHI